MLWTDDEWDIKPRRFKKFKPKDKPEKRPKRRKKDGHSLIVWMFLWPIFLIEELFDGHSN